MKKDKEYIINSLIEKANKSKEEASVITDILDNHFIIGHNNKKEIIADFEKELNVDSDSADELYNICAEILIKGIFK